MSFATKITTNVLVNQLNQLIQKEDFELYYIDEYHHYYNDNQFELEYILLYQNKCILQYNYIYKDEDLLDLNELKSNFENMFNKKLFCELFINLNVLNTTDLNGNQIPTLKNILNLIAVKLSGLYPIEL